MKPADKRLRVWKHNTFFGHARMMQSHLNIIIKADTTTDATREHARDMLAQVKTLVSLLKKRREP